MPCNSDHMSASQWELELSKIYCCLDEMNGLQPEECWWTGYHPKVYCKNITKEVMDSKTKELCELFKTCDCVVLLSLEAQLWWRDHQVADRYRQANEARQRAKAKEQRIIDAAPEMLELLKDIHKRLEEDLIPHQILELTELLNKID